GEGGARRQRAREAAGVDGDGEGAEPGQHWCGQQGGADDTGERPGRPRQPGCAEGRSGGAAELGCRGSGGDNGGGEQDPPGGAAGGGGRGGRGGDRGGRPDGGPGAGMVGGPGRA